MTLIEFQKKVKKDYLFDKVWNYIYSMMFLGIGIYFLFEIFFTDWSQNMTSGSVISIVLMSFFMLSIGIVGIIRTPKLAQIHKISINGDLQNNKEKILEFSRQNKLHQLLDGKDENVLLFRTKSLLKNKREIIFFVDNNDIYFNVQQKNWNGATFMDYKSSKKLIEKIKMGLKAGK